MVLADGRPSARMVDTLGPKVDVPSDVKLRRALKKGKMVLDILLGHGVPIAYATTHILPRLVTAREPLGRDLGIDRTTAVLDLEEVFHVTTGEVVYFSRDIFAPGGLDLHVLRWLEAARPEQVNARGPGRAARARSRPEARQQLGDGVDRLVRPVAVRRVA